MRISLILAHPSGASLCAALASAARDALSGHEVGFHHLDAEGFDPRLGEAELAGRNWWSQPPALLKGWLDRVVRPGVAYEFRRDRCRGVFPRCGIPTSHREVFAVVPPARPSSAPSGLRARRS